MSLRICATFRQIKIYVLDQVCKISRVVHFYVRVEDTCEIVSVHQDHLEAVTLKQVEPNTDFPF